jgi:hypothetical protein
MAQEEEDGSTREACWDFGGSTYYSTLNPTLISCSHPSRTSHELGLTTRASHKGVE